MYRLPDELQTRANFIISVDRDLPNLQPFEKLIWKSRLIYQLLI